MGDLNCLDAHASTHLPSGLGALCDTSHSHTVSPHLSLRNLSQSSMAARINTCLIVTQWS